MEKVYRFDNGHHQVPTFGDSVKDTSTNHAFVDAFTELERGVFTALETYSNVHRGSGFKSEVTSRLFDQARNIMLDYLGLQRSTYTIVFCTPRGAGALTKQLGTDDFQLVSSKDTGLSLGVRAVAVRKKLLPNITPFQSGGGTTRLVSKDWVDLARPPERLEAGTPAIINIIAFARALRFIKKFGNDIFQHPNTETTNIHELLHSDNLGEFTGRELLIELKKTLIGRNTMVPTLEGQRTFINLDSSASTPTFEPVWNAYRKSLHLSTHIQNEIIQEVKVLCAKLVGVSLDEYDVIFTLNTTEAINLVAENLRSASDKETETVIINTLLEHASNDLPWRASPKSSIIRLSVDADGFIDVNELETLLKEYKYQEGLENKRVGIVAISGASNVLGVCNNITEIAHVVHKYDAQLLVDAAQLIAHRKIDMQEAGIDYLAFSAHKLYAPFGCGVLVVRKGLLTFSPLELEEIRTSGEENVAGIAALGKMVDLLLRIGMKVIQEKEKTLTVKTLHALSQIDGLKMYGIKEQTHPAFDQKIGVIVFEIKGMMAGRIAKKLSMQGGIGVRFGCHCAHIIVKQLLHVGPGLEKFQRLFLSFFPWMDLPGLTRISLGLENEEKDIERMVQALQKINKKSKRITPSGDSVQKSLPKKEVQKQIKALLRDTEAKVFCV